MDSLREQGQGQGSRTRTQHTYYIVRRETRDRHVLLMVETSIDVGIRIECVLTEYGEEDRQVGSPVAVGGDACVFLPVLPPFQTGRLLQSLHDFGDEDHKNPDNDDDDDAFAV